MSSSLEVMEVPDEDRQVTVSPDSFFGDNPPPRIMGTEVEYSATGSYCSNVFGIQADVVLRALGEIDGIDILPGSFEFLSDGSRVYKDLASFFEYASPESLGPSDAALREDYGQDLMVAIAKQIKADNDGSGPNVLKINGYINNDGRLETTGYHENHLAPRGIGNRFFPVLSSLIAVRNVITGGGLIDRQGNLFCGAKAHDIGTEYGINRAGHGKKPMIYQGVEHFANIHDWQRIEIRSTDASILPWATFMNLATSSLALRIAEHRAFPSEMQVIKPVDWLHEVSRSANGKVLIQTEGKDKIFPHEWLEEFVKVARELSYRVGLPVDEELAIEELQAALEDYRVDPLLLRDRVDWAAKAYLLENVKGFEKGSTRGMAKRVALQGLWGTIYGNQSIIHNPKISDRLRIARISTVEENRAISDPSKPPLTRASVRTKEAIKRSSLGGVINWHKVKDLDIRDPYEFAA